MTTIKEIKQIKMLLTIKYDGLMISCNVVRGDNTSNRYYIVMYLKNDKNINTPSRLVVDNIVFLSNSWPTELEAWQEALKYPLEKYCK